MVVEAEQRASAAAIILSPAICVSLNYYSPHDELEGGVRTVVCGVCLCMNSGHCIRAMVLFKENRVHVLWHRCRGSCETMSL